MKIGSLLRAALLFVSLAALLNQAPRAEAAFGDPSSSSAGLLKNGQPSNSPSGQRAFWGAYVDGAPFDMSKLTAFENDAQKAVSIVHWGTPWKMNGQFQNFPAGLADAVRQHGSIPMLDWGSQEWGNQLSGGPLQPAFRNSVIYQGTYDSYIQSFATQAKAWGHPFFLRFDHEANGWWFAWDEGNIKGQIINGNQVGDYVKMWQHVHDIFTQVGATNVTWVWCPNIQSTSPHYAPFSQVFPGQQYVDWTCLDGYNSLYYRWQTFADVFNGGGQHFMYNSYKLVTGLAPTKPMMVGETGTVEAQDGGSKKAAWFTDAFQTQLPTNFPLIRAMVYFNITNGSGAYNYAIETSAKAQAAFAASIGLSYYTTNTYSNLNVSPIPPP